ncbi:hypothetical protein MNBD_ALPHA09-522 [hydrothermal vent metagenome]|uniref:Uncharacterized protein n=1 Tax=hydrothermal vent metagenome TaxID=652676 RepID=A0A3B0T9H3_9ZZZZ
MGVVLRFLLERYLHSPIYRGRPVEPSVDSGKAPPKK